MRIGIVCPYDWDFPGGVQFHIRDLAQKLIEWGHEVSVLAPTSEDVERPEWLVDAGRPIAVPYNGAVARVQFGPVAAGRVRRWISEGSFDVLHLHEPGIPSLSLLACWAASGPMVGTFHAAHVRSRALNAASPFLVPALEKLSARIAVSEEARATLIDHHGGDAVVIPNGVNFDLFAGAIPQSRWQGLTLGFVGRFDEPRKGLALLLAAMPNIIKRHPEIRLVIAGRGDSDSLMSRLPTIVKDHCEFLGIVDDQTKASLFASVGVYVAPNTGGESFGIIVAEAMSAGAAIVASDLAAFHAVLDDGNAGVFFSNGDASDLASVISDLLDNTQERINLGVRAQLAALRFDWSQVASQIQSVYEMVAIDGGKVSIGEPNLLIRRRESGQ
ncbi:MAG TPA: glycosyltransferase family 4 protein [Candidatus Nanopelagicaceae bacterium]|nr:glycosyltransferase family 4 protein [Candidatus Nanopelagicaceae bacterium]